MSIFNQELEAKVAQAKKDDAILKSAFVSFVREAKSDSYKPIGFKPRAVKVADSYSGRTRILNSDTESQREVTGYTPKKQGDKFKFYLNER